MIDSRHVCAIVSAISFASSALHLSAAAIGVVQGGNNYRVCVDLCRAIAFGIGPILYFCKPRAWSQEMACVVGAITAQPFFGLSDYIKAVALRNGVDAGIPGL